MAFQGDEGPTLTPAGNGYLVRLAGADPIVARLQPEEDGWSVTLLGATFTAEGKTVARRLPASAQAVEAAAIALGTVRVLETRDDYRYRRRQGSPNRWYIDRTARQPSSWNGTLPDLSGSDAGIRHTALATVQGYLDATFPDLVNLAQHRPHFDPARGRTTDPNEHTVEVLAALDSGALSAEDRMLARLAILYHDVGKGRDAYDPAHPQESARLTAPLLARHGLSAEQEQTVLLQIREHDLLGVLSRGRITVDDAIDRLGLAARPQNLALHAAIATADVSAIRGLRWVVAEGRIARAQRAVAEAAGRRERDR